MPSRLISVIAAAIAAVLLTQGCSSVLEPLFGSGEAGPSPEVSQAARYMDGDGVPLDEARGAALLRAAAETGDREAQFLLGLAYGAGKGVPASEAEAARWLERAAVQGHDQAQFLMGLRYRRGQGVGKDATRAAYWFGQSARLGNAGAQYNLGLVYAGGRGLARDDAAALDWFERAAVQGHAEAQYAAGAMYQMGRGAPENRAWATRWFGRAATQGVAEAAYMTGLARAAGSGIPRDLEKAFFWLEVAARSDVAKAPPMRDRIAARLDAATIERVKETASAWRPLPLRADRLRLDDSPTVMFVQHVLNQLNYRAGPVDGIVGPRTRRAVTAYRRTAGIGGEARIDADLLTRLRDASAGLRR